MIKKNLNKIKNLFKHDEVEEKSHNFLPGVQGILEEPLFGSAWLIPLIIVVFLFTTILWLWFSEVDIISPAQATLLPSSKIKVIQIKEVNVIDEIFVKNGERVVVNQPLVKFASKDLTLTIEAVKEKIAANKIKILVQREFIEFLSKGDSKLIDEKIGQLNLSLTHPEVILEKTILKSKIDSYLAEKKFIDNQADGLRTSIEVVKLEITNLEDTISYQESKLENITLLVESQISTLEEKEEVEQVLLDLRNKLQISKKQLEKSLIDLKGTVEEKFTKKQQKLMESINIESELSQVLKELKNELELKVQEESGKVLYSPIVGNVTELSIYSKHGVVQSGEILMKIVPENSPLEAEAKVNSRDIGFISINQKVNVKIDSFNFTKYGYIKGSIIQISESSILDEQIGPYFAVIVELEKNFINIDNQSIKLKPGMTAVVDIKIGRRKLAEYIISPLLRYRDEAMRER